MRKNFFLIVLFSACLTPSFAQIRHVKGINSIEADFGITKTGNSYALYYSKYFSDRIHIKAGPEMELGESRYKYRVFMINATGSYTFLKIGDFLYFNICTGVNSAFYKNLGESLTVKDNAFKIGLLGGLETEVFLFNNIMLLIDCKENLFADDAFGHYRFFYGIGLKYSIF